MFNCFCKFLVCHDFGLIFLPSHGFVLFPEEKKSIYKKNKKNNSQTTTGAQILIHFSLPCQATTDFHALVITCPIPQYRMHA